MSKPSQRRSAAVPPPLPPVIDLAGFREQRRLSAYQEKISRVVAANRRAIGQLYSTGALFSKEGVKVGRDLLLAHQHLLKVVALLGQLTDADAVPAPRQAGTVAEVFGQLDRLLERTSLLTSRTGNYLARLQPE